MGGVGDREAVVLVTFTSSVPCPGAGAVESLTESAQEPGLSGATKSIDPDTSVRRIPSHPETR
jgi:hypothetical protein